MAPFSDVTKHMKSFDLVIISTSPLIGQTRALVSELGS